MKKLISILLVFLILSTVIVTNNVLATSDSNPSKKELKELDEIKEERTKNKKVFFDPDTKMYTEEIYTYSVHYKDQNGNWEDIDNTILASASGNDQYTNDVLKNNYKLHLNKRSDKALKVSYRDMFVKYLALNTNKIEAHINDNELIFKNAWKSADLQYIAQNDGIKMNIILKNKTAPKKFEFEVASDNLTLVQSKEGILFKDKRNGDNVFQIPKMWVSDSSDPENLRYDRVKEEIISKNGKTIISISVDDSNLVYPLIIDPTTNLYSYGIISDGYPGAIISENLFSPIKAKNISGISVYADYVDPRSGPGEVNFELYANNNFLPERFICYASCSLPTQYPSLGAVKISNTNQTDISASQIVGALGAEFIVKGLTIYGYPYGLTSYSITVTYTTAESPPEKPLIPKNVKVEEVNSTQIKVSWDIAQSNKNYRIRDESTNSVLATTNLNYVVITRTTQNKYSLTAYDPVTYAESDKVVFVFDPSNTITYYYVNNRLDRAVNLKKNETIKYEYDLNGNLKRKYKSIP